MRDLNDLLKSLLGDAPGQSDVEAATSDGRFAAAIDSWMASLAPTEFAACVVAATWRAAVEGHHDMITDAEMAWMNIATTQAVAAVCEPEAPDAEAILDVLCDPAREVLPDVNAGEFFGDWWEALCHDVNELFEATPLPVLVQFGSTMARRW